MDLPSRVPEMVGRLLDKGVRISHPLSVDIGGEVDPARISGDGVTIFPGCRIYGADTVISAGAKLGQEAPVTVDGCRLGPGVELKGGYFKTSVFLEKANLGSGAQVREACLLEEEANGAHCVGLKQTILFPFVTLGSLINFCDCFMAGGTSRKDHSEVGSSYIHFNFTPDGDKTTASLFGDVPRGVLLDQPPIFLGGQGGAVGPLRIGYGTVVAAGSILREDVLTDGQLVVAAAPRKIQRDFMHHAYRNLARLLRSNILYLANLVALEHWYREVRRPFFARQELGELVHEGALKMLAWAKDERGKRLVAMAAKVPDTHPAAAGLREEVAAVVALLSAPALPVEAPAPPAGLQQAFANNSGGYIGSVKALSPEDRSEITAWLQGVVDVLCSEAGRLLTNIDPFP